MLKVQESSHTAIISLCGPGKDGNMKPSSIGSRHMVILHDGCYMDLHRFVLSAE